MRDDYIESWRIIEVSVVVGVGAGAGAVVLVVS
jgi:hypothetical protein